MTFGAPDWGCDEKESHAIIRNYIEAGGNSLDIADIYAGGRSEEIVGTLLPELNRDGLIIASKFSLPSGPAITQFGANRKQIISSCEKSLKRLKTDYIDLYQTHWPDREIRVMGALNYRHGDDPGVPIGETMAALADLIAQGKIRHAGISNVTSWGTMTHLQAAETAGLPRIVSIQNAYNLLTRTFEHGLSEIAQREDVGLLAYSPLAQGYLTGKYQNGALPEGSRKQLFNRLQRYETPNAAPAIDAYLAIAREHGLDPGQMALQFVTTRPFVTSSIIGATTMEQLKSNIASVHVTLTEEVLKEIDRTNRLYTYPCP
jgi:aryl-alcohol dehydrogenase-like predicted oxidoreductase